MKGEFIILFRKGTFTALTSVIRLVPGSIGVSVLYLAAERVEAEADVFHLKNIELASTMNWFAAAWFLERKHP